MNSLPVLKPSADLPSCTPQGLAMLARLRVPLWIYDFERPCIHWANAAGLGFWQAETLDTLRARDFSPTAVGTADRLGNMRRRLAEGERLSERWTLYPQGTPRQIDCTFSGVQLPDGRIGMLVEAGGVPDAPMDLTYEIRAIEAVRQSPLMISLVTSNGHWLMHNPAAEALMHRLAMTNIPNFDNFLALFANPEDAVTLREEALAEGSACATLRLAGAQFRMHDVVLRRLTDPVTGRLSLMLSQQDVTNAFRLERRLHKALAREKAVAETQRQFLLFTSHNFRTPLSIIDGAARRVGKLVGENDPIGDRIRTIRDAVRRMSDAVDTTLASAAIAEGKVAFHPDRVDLRPIVERVVDAQRMLHPDRSIRLDLPELPLLDLDANLVEQVIENLLSNAIKYSPPDLPVEVACKLDWASVTVSVTDHGLGVPADDLPKLFTRFFRSKNAASVKGTGVGLHAVKYFMDLHGGKVSAETVEGQGATFTVTFPVPKG